MADWFSENAPDQQQDWFSQNGPPAPLTTDEESAAAATLGSENPVLENAAQAVVDIGKEQIPRSVEQAAGLLTPAASAPREIATAYRTLSDVLGGKSVEQAAHENQPEAFQLAEADKTEPYSKERFKAGLGEILNLAMAPAIKHGLSRTLFPKVEPAPVAGVTEIPTVASEDMRPVAEESLVQPVTPPEEVKPNAVEEGIKPESSVVEHPVVEEGRPTTETSSGDSVEPSEEKPQEVAPPENAPIPDWAREEMVRRGLNPGRTFNDVDLGNPSVREAIQLDPTMTPEQKAEVVRTGAVTKPSFIEGTPEIGGEVAPEQAAASKRMEPTPAGEPVVVRRPLSALKQIYGAQEKAGQAGYARGLSEARTEGAAAVAQIKTELGMADKWMAGDQEQVRQHMMEFVNKTLPPSERGRFTGAITRALRRPALGSEPGMMYKNAFKVFKSIENRAEEVYRSDAISDIKRTVTRAMDSPSVDIGIKRVIQRVIGDTNLSNPSEATLSKLRNTQDYLRQQEAAGKDVLMPERVLAAVQQLGKTPIKELPTATVENLQLKVRLLERLGRLRVKGREQLWDAEQSDRMGQMLSGESTPLELQTQLRAQPGEKLTLQDKVTNRARAIVSGATQFDLGHMPEDVIFDMVQGGKGTYAGPLFDQVRTPMDAAYDAAQRRRLTATDPLREIVQKNRLTDLDEERIGLWAHLQQEGGEARALATGVTQSTIDKLKETGLTAGQKEAYNYMRKTMDESLPDIQKVMHDLYNIPVEPVDNYFPWMREYEVYKPSPKQVVVDPRTGEPISDAMLDNFGRIAGNFAARNTSKLNRGFTIERQKGAETPIRYDAFDVFDRHMNNASRLIEMQRESKMIGEMVRSPEFGQKYGEYGQKLLNEWLTDTITDGKGSGAHRWPILDMSRRAASRSLVFFRLTSNIKHISAVPQGIANAGGAGYYWRGLSSMMTKEGKDFLSNFPQVTERQAGEMSYAELQRNLVKDPDKLFPKAMTLADRYGFILGKEVDLVNSRSVFIGRYLKNLEDKGKAPDLTAPIDKDAAGNALVFMRRTVSSTLPKDIQPAMGRGMGFGGNVSVARSMNAFRQFALERYSLLRYDTPAAFKSGNYTRGLAIIGASLAAGLYETQIAGAIKKGWNEVLGREQPAEKHPETWQQKLMLDGFNMVPYANMPIQEAQYGESGIPIVDVVTDVGKSAGEVSKAKTDEGKKAAAIRAGGAAGELFGVPGAGRLKEEAGKIFVDKDKMKEQRKEAAAETRRRKKEEGEAE